MTVDQILILAISVVFGVPTLTLLTGIYYRLGVIKTEHDGFKAEFARVWKEVFKLQEKASEQAACKTSFG